MILFTSQPISCFSHSANVLEVTTGLAENVTNVWGTRDNYGVFLFVFWLQSLARALVIVLNVC